MPRWVNGVVNTLINGDFISGSYSFWSCVFRSRADFNRGGFQLFSPSFVLEATPL